MSAAIRCASVALCAAWLLSGCSSSSDTDSTPRSSTTTIDIDAAREQYLAAVEQPNQTFAEFTALRSDEARIQMLPDVIDDLEALARDLREAQWPADVQDEVDAAVTAALTLRTAAVQLMDEPTVDRILERFAEATTDFGAAGAAVRLALGLPLNDQ